MPNSIGTAPLDAAINDITGSGSPGIMGRGLVQPTAPAPVQPDPVIEQLQGLNAKEPGRFKAVSVADLPRVQKEIEAQQPGGFVTGLKSGAISNVSMSGSFVKMLGVALDNNTLYDAGQSLAAYGDSKNEGNEAKVPSIANIRTDSFGNMFSDIGQYLAYGTGSAIGTSLPSVVTGLVAGAAGSWLGPGAAVPAFLAGAAGPSYIQNTGDLYKELTESPGVAEQVKAGKITPKGIAKIAMSVGVPLAALDATGEGLALNALGFKALKKTIMGRIAQGVATGMISEGSTEGAQQIIQEVTSAALGDKKSLGERAISVADNAILGAAGGAALGGPGHVLSGARAATSDAVKLHQAAVAADANSDPAAPAAPAGPDQAAPAAQASAQPSPTNIAPAPQPVRPKPQGPVARALEHGIATEHANTAEAMVPTGSRVTIAMPNIPPMDVTVAGYSAEGMQVQDDQGEIHTLPMNDPEVTVTPHAKPAPVAAAPAADVADAPTPDWLKHNNESAVAAAEHDGSTEAIGKMATEGKTADQIALALNNGMSAADVRAVRDSLGIAPAGPQGGMIAKAVPTAPRAPAPAEQGTLERKIGEAQITMPDEAHAALYDLGQSRRVAQKDSNIGGERLDKVLADKRTKAADALGIPLDQVNAAADEYRNQVDQGAQPGATAPKYEVGAGADEAGKAWDSIEPAARQTILDAAGVKRSPKLNWSSLTDAIKAKLRPHLNGEAKEGTTQPFAKDSGTLGIPREEMPQVAAQSHGALVNHLNAQGIAHETKIVPAADLKPTQAEFSPEKVEAAKTAKGDRAVIASSDGHIIDGHHQALAAQEEGKDVKAIVLDAPVLEALEAVKNSPPAQADTVQWRGDKVPRSQIEGSISAFKAAIAENESAIAALEKSNEKGNTGRLGNLRKKLGERQALLNEAETALGMEPTEFESGDDFSAQKGVVDVTRRVIEAAGHSDAFGALVRSGAKDSEILASYKENIGANVVGAGVERVSATARTDGIHLLMPGPDGKPIKPILKGRALASAIREAMSGNAEPAQAEPKSEPQHAGPRVIVNTVKAEDYLTPEEMAAREKAVKWFGTREKAENYVTKQKLAATHEVVEAKRGRFEIREKAKAEPKAEKWKQIGANRDGHPVFEDANGVRSYTERGIRITEPVGIVPTREGGYAASVNRDREHSADFVPVDPQATRAENAQVGAAAAAEPKGAHPKEPISISAQHATTPAEEQMHGKWRGVASTNEGGRLSVHAYADTAEGARAAAKEKLLREFAQRAEKRASEKKIVAEQIRNTVKNGIHPQGRPFTADELATWTKRAEEAEAEAAAGEKPAPEHPGLVIKSLETGKETTIQPAGTVAPKAAARRSDIMFGGLTELVEYLNRNLSSRYVVSHQGGTVEIYEAGADGKRVRTFMGAPERSVAEALVEKLNKTEPPAAKPAYGASNKLVTAARADEIRARLKDKLKNQLNSGIDPEIIAMGTELAAFHIEAGARKFADFAKAVAADMGSTVGDLRKYLRSWYNGARDLLEDSGHDVTGMDSPDEVRAELKRLAETEDGNGEPAKLDQASGRALEGVPAEAVRGVEGERGTEKRPAKSSGPDLFGNGELAGAGVSPRRGLGDGARDASVPAGGIDGAAARLEAGKPSPETAATPATEIAGNYTITDSDELGEGGQRTKLRQNLEAIQLLNKLENERRRATRSEQAVLAKYVGWGGIKAVFPREDGSVTKGWEKAADDVRALLTPEEYKAASASIRNAHYTSAEVVNAIWSGVRRLGFAGGRMLEPSVGSGNFLGLMPKEASKTTQITAVELDRITGGIVKQLYPNANIQAPVGFQNFVTPDNYFDLAIGNPPFGSERLYDQNRKHLDFSIHNFFFAKSLDAVKPGGVLAMVVSDSLMDSQTDKARAYMAERADLVGAIRLPNDAFSKNAGTEVTTDIIFLRKRMEGEKPSGESWLNARKFKDEEGREMLLNEYFHAHPEQMLGKFGGYGTMYRVGDAALIKNEGQDTGKLLAEAIGRLPQNVMAEPGVEVKPEVVKVPREATSALVGSAFMDSEGKLWVRDQDFLGEAQAKPAELPNERAIERVTGMVRVRDSFAALRKAQLDEAATEKRLDELRARLNKTYDAFVAKNGPINLDANKRLFEDDPTWPQISALEEGFDKGISATIAAKTGEKAREPGAKKAAVFDRRTQFPYAQPTSASSAKDALAISLGEKGHLDLDYMADLYGKSQSDMLDELGDLVFKNPESGYETQDAYLSGNVKRKLAIAAQAAKSDPAYRRNVDALRSVIPADINAADIEVAPGSHWMPPKHIADFADHIAENKGAHAFYSAANARWVMSDIKPSTAASTKWGSERAGVQAILDAALHGSTITIRDRHDDGSSTVNQAATDAANEKVNRVAEEWRRWLWQDDARRDEVAALYNDTFNTDVLRVYDGSHLKLPGKVSDDVVRFRPHQLNFVWRVIQTPTALADHVVGAGKTFELIAAIMELRRMGIAKKPMLTVPNHLVGQWAADFQKLYPGSNVLAATKKDFEAANRKRLFARVATGDWDAVIVAHSSFGKIPVDVEYQKRFIEEQIADLETSIKAIREQDGKKTRNAAQLEKARENLQSKMERMLDAGSKDVGLTFQDIGVDWIGVDEAHEFKNLPFATSMTRIAGMGSAANGINKKSSDLYMKAQSVLEKTGGRNVVFATGTPISNSMAEMFTMQRYLASRTMKDLGIAHFDAWARMFGKVVTDWELSPSGQYKMKSRFAQFVNMPELLQQYRTFADVITRDDIHRQLAAQGRTLGVPKMIGGKPANIVVDRSEHQAQYMGLPIKDKAGNDTENYPEGSLIWRAENLPKKAEKGADNMLKIMSDARKSALDMRLIDPSYPDNPRSKINEAAGRVMDIYRQWHTKKGVQLVFIDLSTPKNAVAKEAEALRLLLAAAEAGDEDAQQKLDAMSPDEFDALNSKFSVYDDLKEKLIVKGIPAHEIAFIHNANTEKQKEELFGKVRSGSVRVLFGSTAKMGAGMNVQNRLVALHHIDAPWRPSDLEQREGRIIRQGNELYNADPEGFEVGVYRYATKNTLDARMWQTIEAKARFIEQVRKGDMAARVIEDIAGEAANAGEMKAAASGNPLILEEMDLRQKVRKLDSQRSNHDREQFTIKNNIKRTANEIEHLKAEIPKMEADAAKIAEMPSEFFIEIDGAEFEKMKEAGAAVLVKAGKMIAGGQDTAEIGKFGGFPLRLDISPAWKGDGFDAKIIIEGAKEYEVDLGDPKAADPTGLARKINNAVRNNMAERVGLSKVRLKGYERDIPQLEKQIAPWAHEAEFEAARERHRAVIAELQPKKKEAPAAQAAAQPAAEADQDEDTTESVAPKAGQGMSAADVRSEIEASPLGKAIGKLIDAGAVKIEDAAPEGSQAAAYVSNNDGVIHLVASNLSAGEVEAELLHEAFHSGVRPLIGDAAWGKLQGRLKGLYQQAKASKGGARSVYDAALARMANAEEKSGKFSADLAPEEFGAYLISEQGTLPRAFADWARDAVGAFKAWVLRRFGAQLGTVTPEQLRSLATAAVREGVAGSAAREGAAARTESIASKASDLAAKIKSPRSLQELSDMVKGLAEDARGPALGFLPLNTLSDWAAKGQVAVKQYIGLNRDMDAYRNKKQVAADDIVGRWRKAVAKGGAKQAQALADLMHESTIAGIDPSGVDSAEARAKAGYASIQKKWAALSPAARSIFSEVKEAYVAQADELDQLLLDNIKKAMDQQIADAERRHKAEMDSIRDDGLTGTERADAEAAANKRLMAAKQKLEFGKKARLAAMRASFEQNRVPEPYFPLARFGQYFATVRDTDGKVLSFTRAESKADLDKLVRDLKREFQGKKIETGVLSNKNDVRSGMDPRVMADIANILGGAGVGDEVMDAIWQRYLAAMPDLSIRKRMIHRGGVSGFHQDALRAFASHMFHAAHQMGRVKYGTDLQELVNQATDQAKIAAPDETIQAMKIANELTLRHEWVMNPTNASWATTATSLGFVYFLGASPASAIVNLSQTAIMGVPILGSRFGMGKTIAALTAAARDFVSGKGGVENAKLSADERAAMSRFNDLGVIDKSMAHDLSGVGDQGADYNPTRVRVMKAVSYLFHHAERFNREVTALAAYRLARAAGSTAAEAVDKAADLTWATHFDYSNTNRPRHTQGDVAKVVLLFKNFQINMLYRLFRDTQQAFAGDTPQARREARFQLAGIMGMYGLMAGSLGVPLMQQLIIPLYGLMFGGDDDKSAKERFRSDVLNALGPQLGGMALDGVPGYLSGLSLTQRMGMPDLWFQGDDREKSTKDWWSGVADDLLGPVWGIGTNIVKGYGVIRDGKGIARGVETMAPTAVRNVMKAWRYEQDGVVNLRGDIVVPDSDIGIKNALKQAIGFTPANVAEQYDRNTEKKNIERRMGDERRGLLDAMAKAVKDGSDADQGHVLDRIAAFNAKPINAARIITPKSIHSSIKMRNRLSEKAENGVIIQNKRLNSLINDQLPKRVY